MSPAMRALVFGLSIACICTPMLFACSGPGETRADIVPLGAVSRLVLPPLQLPIRDDWMPPKCTGRAVTFSGRAGPLQTLPSDTVASIEARAFHDEDYTEVAECFCPKFGTLSRTTEISADTAMVEMARRAASGSQIRVSDVDFLAGPLGPYSEIQAWPSSNPASTLMMRIYWHDPCSLRLTVMATRRSEARGNEFLASAREVAQVSASPPHPDTATSDAERPVFSDPNAALEKAKEYLDQGYISADEFDRLRRSLSGDSK